MPRKKRSRTPGRPATDAAADVRNALLAASRKLFFKHGFDAVTARQIAAEAGTTPAMIHYYFTNKLGLFRAMVQEAIEPFRQMLAAALAPGVEPLPLSVLMTTHMRIAAANPWIASLMLTEVLAEGGRLRSSFMRDIGGQLLPMIVELLERGRASGRYRADLQPRLAALSMLSLCVFPFLSRPVTAPLLQLKLEGAELERLIGHTARLFHEGVENRA